MTEQDFTLLFEILKDIQARTRRVADDIDEIKTRLTLIESHEATFLAMLATSNGRIDRLERRMERIERRLELRDETTL
jgi:predicted nuclease with TOPRIM domain